MKAVTRHNYAVARRENYDNKYDITWYWSTGTLMPSPALSSVTLVNDTLTVQLTAEIKILTKEQIPYQTVVTDTGTGASYLRPDHVFWDDKYWELYGDSDWKNQGRLAHRECILLYNSDSNDVANFPKKPPAFQEEYVDFIDAVTSLKTAMNMLIVPFSNKLPEGC